MSRSFDMKNGNVTVFGQETEFKGVLEFTDNLIITGKFDGTIKATGNLEVDKTAVCNVNIMSADSILISGTVAGNLEATDRVEMRSGSTITGDVTTLRLRIADNVNFHGQVTMLDALPETDIFSITTAEYKESCISHE